jgi:hypothetical protein
MIREFLENNLPESLVGSDYERIGIGGFTFYASVNESASKTATVTANPVENGSTINDHIIKNATTITIEGEVANLYLEPRVLPTSIQEIFPPVGIIQNYLPERTQTQISQINGLISTVDDYISAADEAIEQGQQLYDFFTGKEADQTITAKFLEFFDNVYETNNVIDVECVDKIYNNMVITSFTINKANINNYTFTISLQRIVEAETRLITLTKNADGDAKSQGAALTDKGTQQTKEVDQSFAASLLGGL